MTIQHQQIGRKWQKTEEKSFCHHMQCIFDQKRAKTTKTRSFLELSRDYFINRPKIQFKYAKLRRSYEQILRNWPKR